MGYFMKILVVDDDFTCRNIMHELASSLGKSDVAVNGKEALDAFSAALKNKTPYDLIFLDIILPEMNGQEVLRKIREVEQSYGIGGLDGVKIIMTTILSDFENIKTSFIEQCEGYLIKPVTRDKLMKTLKDLEII
jgi:two-component system chemotaxis response regulator CheY